MVIAADFGASHARVAVTDLEGIVLAEYAEQRQVAEGPDRTVDWLTKTSLRLLSTAGRSASEVAGIGIGVPGPVEFSTGRPINPR